MLVGRKDGNAESSHVREGAWTKENAIVFFTRSTGAVTESRRKPSLMTILMRPRSSAGLKRYSGRKNSGRNRGNRRGSRSPFFVNSCAACQIDRKLYVSPGGRSGLLPKLRLRSWGHFDSRWKNDVLRHNENSSVRHFWSRTSLGESVVRTRGGARLQTHEPPNCKPRHVGCTTGCIHWVLASPSCAKRC